ncbi:MAG: hypothetical protein ACHQE6_03730 [Solirubrobacterales bacterium]
MEFALVLRELARHRRALVVGVFVALAAATLSVYHLDGLGLKPRQLTHSSASTSVFVDTPSSVLGNLTPSFDPLQARATAYANFMASPAVLSMIGQKAGIPGDRIYAAGPVDSQVPRIVEEPTAVQRNVEITGETAPYRLNFNNDPNLPTIGIYAQAPTTAQAILLANAAATSLGQYVRNLQEANSTPAQSRVVIRQLGQASGGVVDGGISKTLAIMVFMGVFLVWCVLVLMAVRFREYWRASVALAADSDEAAPTTNGNGASNGSGDRAGNGVAGPQPAIAELAPRLRASRQ